MKSEPVMVDPVASTLERPGALHRVVVVGGGAGGLELATRLGDKLGKRNQVHVTLIEKARTHFWKPHLHEIAAGSMDIGVYETTLPETLSAINRTGLTTEYKRMFEDSRLTGIFDRETLQKVARVTGVRYLAQLKLGGFRQESKARWGALGLRVLETKSAAIRLFLQIWDSQDGAVVWEGSQELILAYESLAEEAVSLQRAVEASAGELVTRLPRGPAGQQ